MTRKTVEEDVDAPCGALRVYAVAVLLATLVIRFLTRRSGFLESMGLCGLAQLLVVYCHYYVGSEHEDFRRRFRIHLSAFTAVGCAILLSHGGLRVRSFDLVNALVYGVGSGVTTHSVGLIAGAVADLFLDGVRRFATPLECRMCGYDLTGNTSGVCPECGTSIPLPQRGRTAITNGRSTPE